MSMQTKSLDPPKDSTMPERKEQKQHDIVGRVMSLGKVFGTWRILHALGVGSSGSAAVFEIENQITKEHGLLKVVSVFECCGKFDELSDAQKAEYYTELYDRKKLISQEQELLNNLIGSQNIAIPLDQVFSEWRNVYGYGCDMLIREDKMTPLQNLIQAKVHFNESKIVQLGIDVCSALDVCHRSLVIHRNVNPYNILQNGKEQFVLREFNTSVRYRTYEDRIEEDNVFTPAFAAPEQFDNTYGLTVDIYCLGLTLYILCNSNKLPFASTDHPTNVEIMRRISCASLPAPEKASERLKNIILKACAFNPRDRYQSAAEFSAALSSLQT